MKITLRLIALILVIATVMSAALVGCTPDVPEVDETPSASISSEETPEGTPEDTPEETPVATPTETEKEEEPEPLKSDFEVYQSNTICATGNNSVLKSSDGKAVTKTYRGAFKAQQSGELEYKLYFSNNVDSTWGSGSDSYRGMKTKPYKIISAKIVGTAKKASAGELDNPVEITFGGSASRDVEAGETFWCDPFMLDVPEGGSIIFEWTVEYTMIPSTKVNNTYLAFEKREDTGRFGVVQEAPLPDLIGCNRGNAYRIAFWGDSITMGEGAGQATYEFWAAQITDRLGTSVSTWNLGLGYARADDAVNSKSWIEKAKQNDIVIICFGVNDINSGSYNLGLRSADQILKDISTLAKTCADAGCEIIIFSTPPYTYSNSEKVKTWASLVQKLENLADTKGYKFFDFAACLGKSGDPSTPAYGGHPNAAGCTVVAEAFMKAVREDNLIEDK